MSNFTQSEVEFLQSPQLGRLATVGPDGQPHVVPVGFRYNAAEDTIDVGGRGIATSKKYRDVLKNPRAAFVVDEVVSTDPWRIRGIEIRGSAEALPSGGKARGPAFDDEIIRIRPQRIVSWGVEDETLNPHARSVV
jgi:pyridoxamine 5'-phosphate oxidase family protein